MQPAIATRFPDSDPVEFTRRNPVERPFDNPAIAKVKLSALRIDDKQAEWQGEFTV